MTLKQRRTPFDKFLLHVLFPALSNSPLRPLVGAARWWHTSVRPGARTLTRRAAEPPPAAQAAMAPATAA
jgi:hypothetical protein